jgi:transcriptional regulator with XRE-family HTH domain
MPILSKLNTAKAFEKRVKAVVVRIREQRLAKGYTQDFMAIKLRISQNAYSKLESGITKITIDRLFLIAMVLEADIHTLIGN